METSEEKTKKILLILWPYRFRNFDYYRLELNQMERELDLKILVHDLTDLQWIINLNLHSQKTYTGHH